MKLRREPLVAVLEQSPIIEDVSDHDYGHSFYRCLDGGFATALCNWDMGWDTDETKVRLALRGDQYRPRDTELFRVTKAKWFCKDNLGKAEGDNTDRFLSRRAQPVDFSSGQAAAGRNSRYSGLKNM